MRVWYLPGELAGRFLAYSIVVMQPMGLFPIEAQGVDMLAHKFTVWLVIVDLSTASKGNCLEPVVLGYGVCLYCRKTQPTAGGYERTTI